MTREPSSMMEQSPPYSTDTTLFGAINKLARRLIGPIAAAIVLAGCSLDRGFRRNPLDTMGTVSPCDYSTLEFGDFVRVPFASTVSGDKLPQDLKIWSELYGGSAEAVACSLGRVWSNDRRQADDCTIYAVVGQAAAPGQGAYLEYDVPVIDPGRLTSLGPSPFGSRRKPSRSDIYSAEGMSRSSDALRVAPPTKDTDSLVEARMNGERFVIRATGGRVQFRPGDDGMRLAGVNTDFEGVSCDIGDPLLEEHSTSPAPRNGRERPSATPRGTSPDAPEPPPSPHVRSNHHDHRHSIPAFEIRSVFCTGNSGGNSEPTTSQQTIS